MKVFFLFITSLFSAITFSQISVTYELGIENRNNEVILVDGVSYSLKIDSLNSIFTNVTENNHKNFRKSKLAYTGISYKMSNEDFGYVQDYVNGEKVLILDDKSGDWKFTGKTKNIQSFKCYEAVLTHKIFNARTAKYIQAISKAWFTYEIPVKAGPLNYSGLPGLIMELNPISSKFVFIVSQVKFNIENIEVPKVPDYKKMTEEELYNIFIKKSD